MAEGGIDVLMLLAIALGTAAVIGTYRLYAQEEAAKLQRAAKHKHETRALHTKRWMR